MFFFQLKFVFALSKVCQCNKVCTMIPVVATSYKLKYNKEESQQMIYHLIKWLKGLINECIEILEKEAPEWLYETDN